jgi:hypothetical protein
MTIASPPIIPVPPPDVALVDPKTGKATKEGYDFLKRLEVVINKIRTDVSTTVAALPSASVAGAGSRSFVTDANATTFLSVVAGGGANKVPVVSNGANWLIG